MDNVLLLRVFPPPKAQAFGQGRDKKHFFSTLNIDETLAQRN